MSMPASRHERPLVSVVIPVYNGERYLVEAIDSVLAQPHRPLQVLVVDDGSTDRSATVARQFSPAVTYLYQSNSGQAAARNRGAQAAQGAFLGFLDADDLWASDKLALQLAAFAADPALEAVFGTHQQFFSLDADESVVATNRYGAEMTAGYTANTMLIRSDAFRRVGPFDPQWRFGEFIEWHARARDLGLRTRLLPDVLARRRIHGMNMSILHRESARREYARVLKFVLDRRRQIDGTPFAKDQG